MRFDGGINLPFHFVFSLLEYFCVNEPLAHGLALREEGQVELFRGRRPTDLARRDIAKFAGTLSTKSNLRDQLHRELMYRPFQFNKRSQLFIRTHNETLSVAAMRVNDPNRSPFAIQG